MSKFKRNPSGFTLVELLVVVAIISILAAVLITSISLARGAVRKVQCQNNQKNLGLATIKYESMQNHYPGYVNPNGMNWCMVLLQHLGHKDLYDAGPAGSNVTISVFKCPDDAGSSSSSPPLSYPANTAIFTDRSGGDTNNVTTSQVKSLPTTVMLVEKTGSGPWTSTSANAIGFQWAPDVLSKSPHGSTIIVTFCDGHSERLRDDADVTQFRGVP